MDTVIKVSESELVGLAKEGCRQAMATLCQIHGQTVKSFIRKNLFDYATAEDLLQDTFVQILVSIDRFDQKSTFSTWARGIALNLIRNYCNRSPSRKCNSHSEPWLLSQYLDEQTVESAEDQAIMHETLHNLSQTYSTLPKNLKKAVYLIVIDGLSYQDAADKAGVKMHTIKNWLFRARKIFKQKHEW